MAVVEDYYIGDTHIIIRDDAYAGISAEEMQRRKDELNRVCNEVLLELRARGIEPVAMPHLRNQTASV